MDELNGNAAPLEGEGGSVAPETTVVTPPDATTQGPAASGQEAEVPKNPEIARLLGVLKSQQAENATLKEKLAGKTTDKTDLKEHPALAGKEIADDGFVSVETPDGKSVEVPAFLVAEIADLRDMVTNQSQTSVERENAKFAAAEEALTVKIVDQCGEVISEMRKAADPEGEFIRPELQGEFDSIAKDLFIKSVSSKVSSIYDLTEEITNAAIREAYGRTAKLMQIQANAQATTEQPLGLGGIPAIPSGKPLHEQTEEEREATVAGWAARAKNKHGYK